MRKKRGGVWLELAPEQYAEKAEAASGGIRQDHFILPAPLPSASCPRAEQ